MTASVLTSLWEAVLANHRAAADGAEMDVYLLRVYADALEEAGLPRTDAYTLQVSVDRRVAIHHADLPESGGPPLRLYPWNGAWTPEFQADRRWAGQQRKGCWKQQWTRVALAWLRGERERLRWRLMDD